MTGSERAEPDPLADARLAAQLCAVDPLLGGMVLRGDGEYRDAIVGVLAAALPDGAPLRRIPVNIDEDRLQGGLDLAATLARGSVVSGPGILAEADGGIVVLPMAERMAASVAARIAATMDAGEVPGERNSGVQQTRARFLAILLDDGADDQERPPSVLAERVAFWIDLADVGRSAMSQEAIAPRQAHKSRPAASDAAIGAIAATAAALGISSARTMQLALRAATASAWREGRAVIEAADLALAARLVLAPRATLCPQTEEVPPSPPDDRPDTDDRPEKEGIAELRETVLDAAVAALPNGLLSGLGDPGTNRRPSARDGHGEKRKGRRGRPLAARAGKPGGGIRLSLIDTLRAAAPWQKIRGRDRRIQIRRDDLRIRRYETRAEAVTIFAVDASGSAALARLAEAKGAVELLLAEAYVKRSQVALIAFRGTTAQLLVPPTRSLVRARRLLAGLPGGGGTPLAAGLRAAHDLAVTVRKAGRTAFIVVLTDGRANVGLDGLAQRQRARTDAETAAKAIGKAGFASLLVDISSRPSPEGEAIARTMGGRFLALPRGHAEDLHAAIGAAQRA